MVPLDTKARLDDTASYLCGKKWCSVSFPPPFGREPLPEETYIKELDEGTGASLKLTILNPRARVWTLNAGGGASVIKGHRGGGGEGGGDGDGGDGGD